MRFDISNKVIIIRPGYFQGWKGRVFQVFENGHGPPYAIRAQSPDPDLPGYDVILNFFEEDLELEKKYRPWWKFW